jgi:hypothetical protein
MTNHTVVTAPTLALLPIGHTTVAVGAPQPPAGAIAVGGIQVHFGGEAIPHAPQPPAGAIAVEEIQVHFGGEVIPHAPPLPVINHPNMVPNVPPDDEIMAGIQPEVSLILFSIIVDLFICRMQMWWQLWKSTKSTNVVVFKVSEKHNLFF